MGKLGSLWLSSPRTGAEWQSSSFSKGGVLKNAA
jgi:hypothetical protein